MKLMFWMLVAFVSSSTAIRCYQGQIGFGNEREVLQVDCPEGFHFCLKRVFYASDQLDSRDPTFYMCSSARECSTDGEYKETFDENKIIRNVCCSTDFCNKNSATKMQSFAYLILLLLLVRV